MGYRGANGGAAGGGGGAAETGAGAGSAAGAAWAATRSEGAFGDGGAIGAAAEPVAGATGAVPTTAGDIRAPGGGGAISGAGATRAVVVAAAGSSMNATGAGAPNCCWMRWLTDAELSAPQLWQTRRTGDFTISGVTSKAYLAPQAHWIFMDRKVADEVFAHGEVPGSRPDPSRRAVGATGETRCGDGSWGRTRFGYNKGSFLRAIPIWPAGSSRSLILRRR